MSSQDWEKTASERNLMTWSHSCPGLDSIASTLSKHRKGKVIQTDDLYCAVICGPGDCNLQSQEIWHLFGEHIWILKGLDLTPSEYAQRSLRKRAHKEDATVGGTGNDAAFMLQFLLKRELGPVPLWNSFSAAGGHQPLQSRPMNAAVLKCQCFVMILPSSITKPWEWGQRGSIVTW